MFTKARQRFGAKVAAVSAAAVLPAVSSANIDVTEATTAIEGLSTPLTSIGGAIIGIAAVAVGFKWVKGMIFS